MHRARSAPVAAAAFLLLLVLAPTTAARIDPPLRATPQGECGPGSIPETGIQGRVPGDDVAAGKVRTGFLCNTQLVSTFGASGGYKVERYVDAAGHECAYYDTTLVFPANALNVDQAPTGTFVLDMADPARPRRTATLATPAFQTPHESLLLNQKRGLLVAVAGGPATAPGQIDVYDVSADCRTPQLLSSTPMGVLGHESGFAPDGKTFYTASHGSTVITAVDLTDPRRPGILWVGSADNHAITISEDGNRAYLASTGGFPRNEIGARAEVSGVVILDVSEIQQRKVNPQVREVGNVTWPNVTVPQVALPVTIGGTPYLIEADEYSNDDKGRIAANGERVGAARIIDISDETAPRVVSDLRLAVHQPENRADLVGDPDADSFTGGYAGHYCAVPQRRDPGIVACSFFASGLRVFDIRNPMAPKEVAYFVAPVPPGGAANSAFASAAFAPERNEIWYSDANRGFLAVRLTNGAWPKAAAPAAERPRSVPGPAADRPRDRSGTLAATGPVLPIGAGLLLLFLALAARRLTRH